MNILKKIIVTIAIVLCLAPAVAISQTCKPSSIPATTNFHDNGDGTTTDLKTGLMWKKCPEGLTGSACETGTIAGFTWQQALQRVQTINSSGGFAGYTDWRLPNIKELRSIVEEQCYDPSVNLETFPNTGSETFWSSSTEGASVSVWLIDFRGGSDSYANMEGSGLFYVRLVRGGQ